MLSFERNLDCSWLLASSRGTYLKLLERHGETPHHRKIAPDFSPFIKDKGEIVDKQVAFVLRPRYVHRKADDSMARRSCDSNESVTELFFGDDEFRYAVEIKERRGRCVDCVVRGLDQDLCTFV